MWTSSFFFLFFWCVCGGGGGEGGFGLFLFLSSSPNILYFLTEPRLGTLLVLLHGETRILVACVILDC